MKPEYFETFEQFLNARAVFLKPYEAVLTKAEKDRDAASAACLKAWQHHLTTHGKQSAAAYERAKQRRKDAQKAVDLAREDLRVKREEFKTSHF